jgi:hypothetical protein
VGSFLPVLVLFLFLFLGLEEQEKAEEDEENDYAQEKNPFSRNQFHFPLFQQLAVGDGQ